MNEKNAETKVTVRKTTTISSRGIVAIIVILGVFAILWVTRYKVRFIKGTSYVARYNIWTGRVTVVEAELR